MTKYFLSFLLALTACVLLITAEGKNSHEEHKLDEDQLRASLGDARDSIVKYISAPTFTVVSEMIIDKIIAFLAEIDTQEIKDTLQLVRADPKLMQKLTNGLKGDAEDFGWSDPEKAYELIRSALTTFSQMENPQTFFQDLVKIIGAKTKTSLSLSKDEL